MTGARVGIGVVHSEASGTILAGGIALVGGALAFLGVFSYLAARFQYPEVLDGSAPEVLPALLAMGATGRTVWALYGVLPLVFIPAGVGAFGAQIALELAESGRPIWLSGRDTGSIPRQVLGRDVYDWLWWTVMRPSVDSWLGRRLMGQLFVGDPLVGFSRRALMIPMLTSVGRTVGVSNGHPQLEDGRVLDDVRTVVWCTGFRPDFRWIQLPVFGPEGYPNHRRGIVAAAPGLGFVGLRYQYRIGSSLIGGVREDAEYVVRELASHDAHAGRASAAHITT